MAIKMLSSCSKYIHLLNFKTSKRAERRQIVISLILISYSLIKHEIAYLQTSNNKKWMIHPRIYLINDHFRINFIDWILHATRTWTTTRTMYMFYSLHLIQDHALWLDHDNLNKCRAHFAYVRCEFPLFSVDSSLNAEWWNEDGLSNTHTRVRLFSSDH